MRPLTVLTGFLLGSAAATTFSLIAILVVYLFLLDEHPQFAIELPILARYAAALLALTALTAIGFVGLLRHRAWRWWAMAALVAGYAAAIAGYWQWRLAAS